MLITFCDSSGGVGIFFGFVLFFEPEGKNPHGLDVAFLILETCSHSAVNLKQFSFVPPFHLKTHKLQIPLKTDQHYPCTAEITDNTIEFYTI